jgi:hypothetical protein
VQTEQFTNPKNQTRYRIVVDGVVTEDLNGMGWRSSERALNFWDSKNGLPIRGMSRAERRAVYLVEKVKWEERQAAERAAETEAMDKITALLDQQSVWNREELQAAVGVDESVFNRALWRIPNDKVIYCAGGNSIHKKTKALAVLQREARKAVGTYNGAAVDIIPDSNAAPVLNGKMSSGYNRRKWGGYQPSSILVTVGQYWLAPIAEAIAETYDYDA